MRADLVSILENEYSFMKNVYVETGDGWYQIVYQGKSGWIAASQAQIVE